MKKRALVLNKENLCTLNPEAMTRAHGGQGYYSFAACRTEYCTRYGCPTEICTRYCPR